MDREIHGFISANIKVENIWRSKLSLTLYPRGEYCYFNSELRRYKSLKKIKVRWDLGKVPYSAKIAKCSYSTCSHNLIAKNLKGDFK